MNQCPEVEPLLSREPGALAHARDCDACTTLLALEAVREERLGERGDECIEAEVLLALRSAGLATAEQADELVSHLQRCGECNEVAARVLASPDEPAQAASAALASPPPRPAALRTALFALAAALTLAAAVAMVSRTRSAPAPAAVAEAVAPSKPGLAPPEPQSQPGSLPVAPALPSVPAPPAARPPSPELVDPWAQGTSRPPPAPTPGVGHLTVACIPFCDRVIAGGKNLGPSPVIKAALPAGRVNLELRRGAIRRALSVQIVAGETRTVRISLKDEPAVVDPWSR